MYAELIALVEALSYIAYIYIQHLTRYTSTFQRTPIANAIIEIILNLKSLIKNVLLQWISSHVGIMANERINIYAKEASSDENVINMLLFYTRYLYFIKDKCRRNWKDYFIKRSKEKGTWYKIIQPQPWNVPVTNHCFRELQVEQLEAYSASDLATLLYCIVKLNVSKRK